MFEREWIKHAGVRREVDGKHREGEGKREGEAKKEYKESSNRLPESSGGVPCRFEGGERGRSVELTHFCAAKKKTQKPRKNEEEKERLESEGRAATSQARQNGRGLVCLFVKESRLCDSKMLNAK